MVFNLYLNDHKQGGIGQDQRCTAEDTGSAWFHQSRYARQHLVSVRVRCVFSCVHASPRNAHVLGRGVFRGAQRIIHAVLM